MAAQPGSDIPRASASEFMDSAVPMALQCPTEGAEAAILSMKVSVLISPVANCLRASQIIVPEPAKRCCHQPSSMGPPEKTMAGIFTVAAAIRHAGVVLSQPVVVTTASTG